MANKWLNQLKQLDGAVTKRFDPFNAGNLLRSPSPSVNWLFGKTHGLPFGYGALFWGMPKGGKSLLFRAMIGQMHRDYPNYIAINFDTEFRDEGQMDELTAAAYGIDLDRYLTFQVNKPSQVFDRIHGPIAEMIAKGAPIKLIGIDSVNGIMGRRTAANSSVDDFTIGDHAQTMQIGLQSIIEVQRRNRIALILTAQERAEMDKWEAMRSKTKAAVSYAVKHHCEYFVNLERNKTKDGQKGALGQKFEDLTKKGMDGETEMTGHQIKVWMQDSSMGPKNRMASFAIDYHRGIVNQHEELFELGKNWGVIKKPSAKMYAIGEQSFNGKPATIAALESSPELRLYVSNGLLDREKQPPRELTEEEALAAFAELQASDDSAE